jgi:hypothetical protein
MGGRGRRVTPSRGQLPPWMHAYMQPCRELRAQIPATPSPVLRAFAGGSLRGWQGEEGGEEVDDGGLGFHPRSPKRRRREGSGDAVRC